MGKSMFMKTKLAVFVAFVIVASLVLGAGSAMAEEYTGQDTWVFTGKFSGVPVAGAFITFTRVATGWKQTGYTNSAGEATFSYIAAPGEIYVTTAEKSGYYPGRWEDKLISPGNWQSVSSTGLVEITPQTTPQVTPQLSPRPAPAPIVGEITGRVVNTAWQVVPNATIRVDDIPVTFDVRDGHFIAGMIPAGIHTVYYDAPGYISQTQTIEIKEGQTTNCPACILSPFFTAVDQSGGYGEIYGLAVDCYGYGIPGTCVRINNTIMPTNAKGEYRFTLVEAGTYTICYDAPGYNSYTQVLVVKPNSVSTAKKVVMYRYVYELSHISIT